MGHSRRTVAAVAALGISMSLAACGSDSSDGGGGKKVQLALVAYSTPQAAFQQLIKAFQTTPAGKNITFTLSYGASGDQSRAVAAGLKADVVDFSLEPDVTRLVKAGLVASDWNSNPQHGFITDSVVTITTRKGNPKNLKDWPVFIKPGIQVITPNPSTSGGARWNILAGNGAASNKGAVRPAGVAYLQSLLKNVPVQDDSGRKALLFFVGGLGVAVFFFVFVVFFVLLLGL